MYEVKQNELRAGLAIDTGRNLHVMGIEISVEYFEGIFADTNHNALRVVELDVTGFEKIPFLVLSMPARTVILHHQLAAAGQVEFHVEPDFPASDADMYVLTTVTDHEVEQREEVALLLGGSPIACQRA
ncbi:MAG TPA: hypothetical protein VNV62_18325 [Trebonia sp.]|nr:hypothetical protein [Trebonia sp.]